jgi:hypothetical protein
MARNQTNTRRMAWAMLLLLPAALLLLLPYAAKGSPARCTGVPADIFAIPLTVLPTSMKAPFEAPASAAGALQRHCLILPLLC